MVKPMGKLTLSQGNATLDQVIQLLSKFNFPKSSNEVVKIKSELNDTKNFSILNSTFKVLQTTFVTEYNTNPHRVLCSTFFKKRVNVTIKFNVQGLNDIRLDKIWGNMIRYRAKSRDVLIKLDNILHNGSHTEEEKCISISYLYLASIDGVYGKNLKDVVIFDMLSKNEKVDYRKIERMKLGEIIEYFKNIEKSECLFDGWNEEIRNAIAHSSFWYDSNKQKIIYEERRKNIINEKTKEEVSEMIEKLTDIDELVFFYNQIFRIDKVIDDLR
ncbi:hypothetical protein [Nitrosopumilus sp.]|uniref:hypothetical protein n=1 Tax=Nitrosopumilus sp. TaxID=2024843 RepID=UPI003D121357